ncbi:hypothetical protein CMQ_7121 [Grosmannia clavigera kw1407]|uniref:Uncharacterized protein n=1 Tax=Grosmannia clavigera (strain kw1407 / UAMH 11150) TaxID=655863 RepID=F0XPA4_GROCL|nr:uncharacterized protein CMQ_7121 [Grosmannia clavigera kw1407]EFX00119.1 hypothetical protein CMQ_7121 [Grosmannia clavigera kw1407]
MSSISDQIPDLLDGLELVQHELTHSPSSSHPPGSTPTAAPRNKAALKPDTVPPDGIPLSRPIAIPQVRHGRGRPFVRAYPPSLEVHAITQAKFLEFLDGLNIVSTANPPLRALNTAGDLVTNVPYHWALLAGYGMQAVAELGTVVVSRSRTKSYVKKMNEKLFEPRGLHVDIFSTAKMKEALGIPEEHPVIAPLTQETVEKTAVERQLLGIRQHNADLDLKVPPPAKPEKLLDRWSARHVKKQMEKSKKKALKKNKKAVNKADTKRDHKEEQKTRKISWIVITSL